MTVILILVIGCLGIISEGFKDILNRSKLTAIDTPRQLNLLQQNSKVCFNRDIRDSCKFNYSVGDYKNVIFVGDSVIDSLTPIAKEIFLRMNFGVEVITHPGCYFHPNAVLNVKDRATNDCNVKRLDELSYLAGLQPSIIIIGGALDSYLSGSYYADSKKITGARLIPRELNSDYRVEDVNIVTSRMAKGFEKLVGSGHKIIFLSPTPSFMNFSSSRTSYKIVDSVSKRSAYDFEFDIHENRTRAANIFLKTQTEENKIEVIDLDNALCPYYGANRRYCGFVSDGNILYSDHQHFSEHGARIVVQEVLRKSTFFK
jgi:hypothetical protein